MSIPPAPSPDTFDLMSAELISAIDAWSADSDSWDEATLDEWARRAFRLQFEGNSAYRKYCEARGVAPDGVSGWKEAVPVPTTAFRVVDLVVGSGSGASLTFVTSGTTRGREARGRHLVRSPELYRTSLRAGFRHFVMQGREAAKIVTLPPTFTIDDDSSLGWMLDDLRGGLGAGDGTGAASRAGIDWARLDGEAIESVRSGRPLCILGTTLGFAGWLERIEDGRSPSARLPEGSAVMDTGGVKGRPGVDRSRVVRRLADELGLPDDAVINEFGMTELLSQRYACGDPAVPLLGPPWLRSRVLDPLTLNELPDGEVGILCHYDLANLGSVCAVLTEDRGRIVGQGIEWIGRTEGAPPRGCSLATAELLEAQDRA